MSRKEAIFTLVLAGGLTLFFLYCYMNGNSIHEQQRRFCHNNGGMPIEPDYPKRVSVTCIFDYKNTSVEYIGRCGKGNCCFSCWDTRSCESKHNDILRNMGVHC